MMMLRLRMNSDVRQFPDIKCDLLLSLVTVIEIVEKSIRSSLKRIYVYRRVSIIKLITFSIKYSYQ